MILQGGGVITSYSKYSWRKFLNINHQKKFRVHFCRHLYPSWLWYSLASLKIFVLHLSCDLPWRCAHGLLARRCYWLWCTLLTGLWNSGSLICSWLSLLNGFALDMDEVWKIKSLSNQIPTESGKSSWQ